MSPDTLVHTRQNRQPADPAGPTGQLATWLADFRLEDVPVATRQRALHLLLDGVGCALVGAQLPWSRRAAESVCRLEGAGPALLIGWNRSLPAPAAALLNGTFIQGFELDDFHPFAPLHSASLVLPALLATAQMRGPIRGADFLKAAIAGFEVAAGTPAPCSGPMPPPPPQAACCASMPPSSRTRSAWPGPSRAA